MKLCCVKQEEDQFNILKRFYRPSPKCFTQNEEESLDWEMKSRNHYLTSHLSTLAQEDGTCSHTQACNDKYNVRICHLYLVRGRGLWPPLAPFAPFPKLMFTTVDFGPFPPHLPPPRICCLRPRTSSPTQLLPKLMSAARDVAHPLHFFIQL